jgi:transcriptional regulator with XRE-family HTH domain
MANLEKLNEISKGNSNWIEKAKERQNNKDRLRHSRRIAVKILKALRDKEMRQKELARIINVSPQQISKIVKGKENLTLDTITKLENALDINLISDEPKPVKEYIVKKEYIFYPVPNIEKPRQIVKPKKSYKKGYEYNLNMVFEKDIVYGEC